MLTNCETCAHYEYDEYFECYVCSVSLDEDEMQRFLSKDASCCPYWRDGDEYAVVKKQK